MLYRCKNCEEIEAKGFLPCMSCGIYILALMLLVASLLPFPERYFFGPLQHKWLWLAGNLILGFFGGLLLNAFFELIEWLFCTGRCSHCNSRKWSWGFTRGFGL